MRGKVHAIATLCRCDGITPAYAGKSAGYEGASNYTRDHPRLCGEKFVQHLQCYLYTGSPPPMRGKVPSSYVLGKYGRITPAYAGKSAASSYTRLSSWDHPRLCGEKILPVRYTLPISGSPPPMRGKGNSESNPAKRLRITPAYAGKSKRFCVMLRTVQDHPRLCGEKWGQPM